MQADAAERGNTPWSPAVILGLVMAAALAVRVVRLPGLEYDWDEGTYWQSLESLRQGHALFREVFSSQPPMFLGGLEPVYRLFGGGIVVARAEVAVLSLVGLLATWYIAREIGGPWAGIFATALLAFDPLYLRLSDTLQADLPCATVALAALALAVASRRRDDPRLWLGAGLVLGLGIGVKLLAVAYGPPLVLLALASRRPVRAIAAAAGGLLAAAAVVLLPYAGEVGQVYRQAIGLHVGTRTAEPQSFAEKLGVLLQGHPPFATLLAAGAGAALGHRRRLWLAWLATWLAAGLAVDLGQAPLFSHHLVILLPPVAIAAGLTPGELAALLARRSARPRPALVAALLAVAIFAAMVVAPGASGTLPYPDPRDRAVEAALRSLVPPGAPVVTDLQFSAVDTGHVTPPQLVDVSFARVWTGDLGLAETVRATEAAHAAAVVFATRRLESIPGFRAWVAAHFRHAEDPATGVELWVRPG